MGKRGSTPGIDPNAARQPDGRAGVKAEFMSEEELAALEKQRRDRDKADALLDEKLTMPQADAQREAPRPRTDNVNPNRAQTLGDETKLRTMLSSRQKKELNRKKVGWIKGLPKVRKNVVAQVAVSSDGGAILEALNREMVAAGGERSKLAPATRKYAEALDRSIQQYERDNAREHVVYTIAEPPDTTAEGMALFRSAVADMAARGATMQFDRYIPADHSAGNLATKAGEVLYEIKTTRGAYLGSSDSKPGAQHLISRGLQTKVVGVREVNIVDANGQEYTRTVIQLEEVPVEGRTEAK